MTLARKSGNRTRLTNCPFCEADLRGKSQAEHLDECEAFRAAWGHDARGPRPDARA